MSALSLATMRLLVGPVPKDSKDPVPAMRKWGTCPNGYALIPALLATEGQPRPIGDEAHVPPKNTSGEYLMPVPACGDNTTPGAPKKPCTYCQSSHRDYQSTLRNMALYSTAMVETEKTEGRRMTAQEAYMVYNHLVGYGCMPVDTHNEGPIKAVWRETCRRNGSVGSSTYALYKRAKEAEKRVAMAEREARMSRPRPMVTAAFSLPAFGTPKPESGTSVTVRERPTDRAAYRDDDGELPCGHYLYTDEGIQSSNCNCPIRDSWRPYGEDVSYGGGRYRDNSHGEPFHGKRGAGTVRLVGVEVECNNAPNLVAWAKRWRGAIHTDGSCGYEAVTTPVAGTHVRDCLVELTATLKEQRNTADNRCGVHVHVDARDIMWPAMLRILRVYSLLEPILYLIGGQNRLAGTYCKKAGANFREALDSTDPKAGVLAAAFRSGPGLGRQNTPFDSWTSSVPAGEKAGDVRSYVRSRPGKKDGARYRGINIIPWIVGRRTNAPDTTIEFRMHRNSLDGARIAEWARLLATIVDWCDAATDAEVAALPRSALRALVTVIAPTFRPWVMSRVKGWRRATTAQSAGGTTEAGETLPKRHIAVGKAKDEKGKAVWSCAV